MFVYVSELTVDGQISQNILIERHTCAQHTRTQYVEIKCQLDATEVFIADLIACSTCFGHHHAHHQELKSIIQWLLPVVFCAVVFQVAGLVWSWGLCVRFAGCWQQPANRTHNPQLHTRPATWKTTAQNTTGINHCIILLSSWWWAWWCPKHVEQVIRSAIKTSVATSWHFISTY